MQMPAEKALEEHCCLEICLQQAPLAQCWGLPDSALSPAASKQSHSAEKRRHLNLPECNLLCLAGSAPQELP